MIGMSETTDPEGNEVAAALTTPEAWRDFLQRYGELYVKVCADEEELGDLLDEDQLEALDQGGNVELWLGEAPARKEALAAAEERLGVRFPPSLRGSSWRATGGRASTTIWTASIRAAPSNGCGTARPAAA